MVIGTKAAMAYADALQRATNAPAGGPSSAIKSGSGPAFSDMVRDVIEQSAQSMVNGEKAAIQATAGGDGELIDLVTAVTSAEVTLQTVVAVRDRVIQAYQDIIQMPI